MVFQITREVKLIYTILYSIISTLTVERVMSPHIAEIIGNLKANAMSITKKSKNLRRRVKNAFLGPENGPKSFKSIFFETSSTFNPEFFRAKSTQKNLTKQHKWVCRQTELFFLSGSQTEV